MNRSAFSSLISKRGTGMKHGNHGAKKKKKVAVKKKVVKKNKKKSYG